jgi:hypothetical protein
MTSIVMLNLFQHPAPSRSEGENWTLKQVQGDGVPPYGGKEGARR